MATVRQLQEWLTAFEPDDVVYALQGLDDGIMVVSPIRRRFLHAAEADPEVREMIAELMRFERAQDRRRREENRHQGD